MDEIEIKVVQPKVTERNNCSEEVISTQFSHGDIGTGGWTVELTVQVTSLLISVGTVQVCLMAITWLPLSSVIDKPITGN